MKNNKFLVVSLAAVMSLSLVGCSKQASSVNNETSIKQLQGSELSKIQNDDKEKENYLVIDVRPNAEYKEGHLKYAVNIEVTDIEKNIEQISKWRNKEVVVYGATEEQAKAGAAALVKQGYKKVSTADTVSKGNYELVKYTNLIGAKFQDAIWDAKGQFYDLREKKDFDTSHVFDAKNISAKNLDELAKELPEDKEKELYFYSYDDNDSSKAAQKAYELGYKNVYNAIDGTNEFNYKYEVADCCLPGASDSEHAGHNHEGHDMSSHEGHDMSAHAGHDMSSHVSHVGHDMSMHMGHNYMIHNHHAGHNYVVNHVGHNHSMHNMTNHMNHGVATKPSTVVDNHANHDMTNHNHDTAVEENNTTNNHANHDMTNHNHDVAVEENNTTDNHANHDMTNHNHDAAVEENNTANNHANHDMTNHNHETTMQDNNTAANHAGHDMSSHTSHMHA